MADTDAVKREPFPIPLLDELDQPYSNFGNLGLPNRPQAELLPHA